MKNSKILNPCILASMFLLIAVFNQPGMARNGKADLKLNQHSGFTKNIGQLLNGNGRTAEAFYYSNSGNMSYYLLNDRISYVFSKYNKESENDSLYRMDLTFEKGYSRIALKENNRLYYKNFYLSHSANAGLNNAGVFESIDYIGLSGTGVNLNCKITNGLQLKFTLNSHTSPDVLKFNFDSAKKVSLAEGGVLSVESPAGILSYGAPKAYQVIGKAQIPVAISFLLENNKISFIMGSYDPSYELEVVIAPNPNLPTGGPAGTQYWSTYVEGSLEDVNHDVWLDADNNLYCTGETYSNTFYFPSTGGQYTVHSGYFDAFVLKFNADRVLQWGSYFGGSQGSDIGLQVAVNSEGFVYVAGETYSNDIPACITCLADPTYLQDSTIGGGVDIFIAKFDSLGQLGDSTKGTFASYFGGDSFDRLMSMTIDKADNVYLSGWISTSGSSNFPNVTLAGAYNQPFGQSNDYSDGFITKINSLNTIIWSTAIGGNSGAYLPEMISDLATDNNNNLYATGRSSANGDSNNIAAAPCTNYTSNYFPLCNPGTPHAYVQNNHGGSDAIVMKFNSNDAIEWSTFFGGQQDENSHLESTVGGYLNCGITVNSFGNIFISGSTNSSVYEDDPVNGTPLDFPHHVATGTGGYNQAVYGGGDMDAFIVKFNSDKEIVWSTYYGDNGTDVCTAAAANTFGEIYFTGLTNSNNFPIQIASGSYNQSQYGYTQDAFFSQFNDAGIYKYGTYYGGNGTDVSRSITSEPNGSNVVFCGGTTSSDFPVADNTIAGTAYMDPGSGNFVGDAFITNLKNKGSISPRISEKQENSSELERIQIYPNPANQYITPVIKNAEELTQVLVFTISGKLVKSLDKINNLVFTGDLPAGLYIMKAKLVSGEMKIAKFIIER